MRRDRRDAVMGSGVGVGAEVPSVALRLDLNRLGRWCGVCWTGVRSGLALNTLLRTPYVQHIPLEWAKKGCGARSERYVAVIEN